MRRFTPASAAAAVALTIAIPVGAQADSDEPLDRSDAADHVERLWLECGVRAADRGPVVGCTWTAPMSPRAAGIKLFRLDPATDPHRRVIFRTRDLEVTHHTDTEVRPGHRYAYAVQAVDEEGRVVGQSRTEWVDVPAEQDVEALRLACSLEPARERIGCEWRLPQHPDAYVVTLWRSADDGPRERVERFRPAGPNAYRDPVPAGASEVTYAVVVTSERDRIVGRSRPETVRIPSVRPTEPRLIDAAPVVPPVTDAAAVTEAAPAVTDAAPDATASDVTASDATAPAGTMTARVVASAQPARASSVSRLRAPLRADILRLIRELAAL